MTSLADDVHGNATEVVGSITATTCSVPQLIVAGGSYSCTFNAALTGNAGASETDTVTAGGTDDDGKAVTAAGSATVTFTDVKPTMTVTKTANPTTLPEPGGPVSFALLVQNTSPEPIVLTSARDDVYGDLNGRGTCLLPQTIATGGSYSCTATGPVTGDAGDRRTDTITAIARDDDGNTVTEEAEATVTITDVTPTISASKRAEPTELPEPGGQASFTVRVENPSIEDVVLSSLSDNVYGSLNGKGTCKLPQTLTKSGGTYTCSFSGMVSGDAGAVKTDTVTASAADNEGNPAVATASASVTIIDVKPGLRLQKTAVPASLPEPGGDYDLVIVVTNESPVEPLTLTTLVDDPLGNLDGQGDCSVPQTVAPLGTYSCSIPQTLAGSAGASETDTVTATGQDNEGNTVTKTDGATFVITDVPPTFTLTKTADPSTIAEPGADVEFSVTITNDGPEELTLTTLVDDNYGDLDGVGTCDVPQTVLPGGAYSCSFVQYVANDAGETKIDIVSATMTDNEGNTVTKTDSATVTTVDAAPTFSVEKSLLYPVSLPEPGGTAFYRIVVTNTGREPLTITRLVDDVGGGPVDLDGRGSCSVPQTIPIGGFYACSFSVPVSGDARGTVSDTVTVTAEDNEGTVVEGFDTAEVVITDVQPSIDLDKSASPASVPEPGGDVTFAVRVHNNFIEDVTLDSLVDDVYGDLNGQGTCVTPQTISPQGSYECQFVAFVSGAVPDLATDTVTGSATDNEGNTVTDSDSATVGVGSGGGTRTIITKTADPITLPEPGGTFTFTVSITSPEGMLVTDLVDIPYGNLSGQSDCVTPLKIAAGATVTCSFTGTFTGDPGDAQTDLVRVGGIVDGKPYVGFASATVRITDILPALTVTKAATPNPIDEPGGPLRYEIEVTNTSAEAAFLTTLFDDVYGDLNGKGDCEADPTVVVKPGGTYTCSFLEAVTGDAGEVETDFVLAELSDDDGNHAVSVAREDVRIADVKPTITVRKTATPTSIPEPGGTVSFGIAVRNTSPEPVRVTSLVDIPYGNLSGKGSCLTPQTIPPGDTYACSFPAQVSGNAGTTATDTVTATAEDDDRNTVAQSAPASVLITPAVPSLSVRKVANPASVPEPGGDVTYAVTITNTSVQTDPVRVQSLSDTLNGVTSVPTGLACNVAGSPVSVPFILASGQSASCAFPGRVEGNAGSSVSDTFRASGVDDELVPVSATGSARVPVTDVLPTMVVQKAASPNPIEEPGGAVTYTASVRNTSPEPVTLTTLVDDVEGNLDGVGTCDVPSVIRVGATYTCRWSGTVSGDAGDVRSNILTARANDDDGNVVSQSVRADVDIVNVDPQFRVFKSADPTSLPEPGGPVTFTVTLVNDSRENVTINSFVDVPYGNLDGKGTCRLPQTLTPNGGFYTCSFRTTVTGTASASPYVDTVAAAVSDNEENQVVQFARAQVVLTDVKPAITVTKTATPTSRPEPGGSFSFAVNVANTSVEPVTLTSLGDDIYGNIADASNPKLTGTTCSLPQMIAVGGSYACAFTVAFTGNPKTQTDIVTATARDDEGNPATATDDATITITDVRPSIGVTKTPNPASLPSPEDRWPSPSPSPTARRWIPLTITSLTDTVFGTLEGDADCRVGTVLPPGATCDFAQTFAVTGSAATGPHSDIFRARGRDDDTPATVTATATARVTFTDVLPSITVAKTATPLTLPEPGGPFTFSITVTNTSVEPVTLQSLVDVPYGDITRVAGRITATTCAVPRAIGVGGSYSCSFTGTFTGNAGASQTDVVTATARDDEGNPATASDDAAVRLTDVLPTMSVTKTPVPTSLPEPGGPVTFTFTVTNGSAVDPLTITSLTDTDFTLSGDADCQVGTVLAPRATCSFTQIVTITGDASGPAHEDTFTATGSDDDGNPTSAFATATVTFTDVLPGIAITKTPRPGSLPEPGGAFTFDLDISNASDEPVTLTSLVDVPYGDVTVVAGAITATTCALPASIAARDSYACSFAGTFTGAPGASQTDIVTARAEDDEGNPAAASAQATVRLTDVPSSIVVTKDASPTSVPEPGAVVTFSLAVENSSPVDTVTLESLLDDIYGDVTVVAEPIRATTCDLAPPVTLAPGESYLCSFDAFTAGDAGDTVTDTVTASGTDDDGNPVSNEDSADVLVTDVLPTIALTKTPTPTSLPEPGGEFTFGLVLANTSIEPVSLESLVDDIYGDVTVLGDDITATDCVLPQVLAIGGSYACSFTGAFTGNAADAQTDTVTATATDNEENETTAEARATVRLTDVLPSMSVTKTPAPMVLPEPGGPVAFTFTVSNTSGVDPLTITSLSDSDFGGLTGDADCRVGTVLPPAPGPASSCTFTQTFPVAGSAAGPAHQDTFTAAGQDDDGSPTSATATAIVAFTDVLPSISITKTPSPSSLPEPGGPFSFGLLVSNTSVEPVTLTSLVDAPYGDVTKVAGLITATTCVLPVALPAGGTYACSFTGAFTGNAGATQTDTVTATAADDEGDPATATASATVSLTPVPPVISVTKTPDRAVVQAPGGDVVFTITVTNESTFEPVTLTGLVDDVYGDLDGVGQCLADGGVVIPPGGTYTCRFIGRVTGASGDTHRNTVTATATDDDEVVSAVSSAAVAEVVIGGAGVGGGLPDTDTTDTGMPPRGDPWTPLRLLILLLAGSVVTLALGWRVTRGARS